MFESYYSYEIEFIAYGKPTYLQFKFVESRILENNEKVKRIYMIGDSIEEDVRGANQANIENNKDGGVEWNSIVVRSGLYKGNKQDLQKISLNP